MLAEPEQPSHERGKGLRHLTARNEPVQPYKIAPEIGLFSIGRAVTFKVAIRMVTAFDVDEPLLERASKIYPRTAETKIAKIRSYPFVG